MKAQPNKDNIINIELRKGNHCSYFVDTNGLLKGRWGGFKEIGYGKGYEIYYNRYSIYIPINKLGFFYNIFDCRKYDAVLRIAGNTYICEKDNKLGLIDSKENILINIEYKSIITYKLSDIICLVKSETGYFIYNTYTKKTSKEYKELVFSYARNNEFGEYIYYRYKNKRKFGLLDINGNEIVDSKYHLNRTSNNLYYIYDNYHYLVSFKDGLYYGLIPIQEFDNCFRVGTKDECFYVTEKNKKFGLLTKHFKIEIITEPYFDKIILDKRGDNIFENGYYKISKGDILGNWGTFVFIIAKKGDKYWLFNGRSGSCVLDNCDSIIFIEKRRHGVNIKEPYLEFFKDGKHGFITSGGFKIFEEDYEKITFNSSSFIYITKNEKHGIITHLGSVLIPCEYDSIERIDQNYYLAKKGDIIEKINIRKIYNSEDSFKNDEPHYSKYVGSFAQDEMGYSDEDIDTVFDGDPDAYWNID